MTANRNLTVQVLNEEIGIKVDRVNLTIYVLWHDGSYYTMCSLGSAEYMCSICLIQCLGSELDLNHVWSLHRNYVNNYFVNIMLWLCMIGCDSQKVKFSVWPLGKLFPSFKKKERENKKMVSYNSWILKIYICFYLFKKNEMVLT